MGGYDDSHFNDNDEGKKRKVNNVVRKSTLFYDQFRLALLTKNCT